MLVTQTNNRRLQFMTGRWTALSTFGARSDVMFQSSDGMCRELDMRGPAHDNNSALRVSCITGGHLGTV